MSEARQLALKRIGEPDERLLHLVQRLEDLLKRKGDHHAGLIEEIDLKLVGHPLEVPEGEAKRLEQALHVAPVEAARLGSEQARLELAEPEERLLGLGELLAGDPQLPRELVQREEQLPEGVRVLLDGLDAGELLGGRRPGHEQPGDAAQHAKAARYNAAQSSEST